MSKHPGRTKQKLAKLLNDTFPDALFDAADLIDAKGYWRGEKRRPVNDTYRWEGYGILRESNIKIIVQSFDTMTECVRRGITFTREVVWAIDVSAKD